MTVEDILATPYLCIGTHEEMAEHLLRCRDRWGITYYSVRSLERNCARDEALVLRRRPRLTQDRGSGREGRLGRRAAQGALGQEEDRTDEEADGADEGAQVGQRQAHQLAVGLDVGGDR